MRRRRNRRQIQGKDAQTGGGKTGSLAGALASSGTLQAVNKELFGEEAEAEAVEASAVTADYSISGQDTAPALTSGEVLSTRALLIDWDTRSVVAQRGAGDRINPGVYDEDSDSSGGGRACDGPG